MILGLTIAAGVVALCALLGKKLAGGEARPLWGNWAVLHPFYNEGAAFGVKKLKLWAVIPLSLAALALLTWELLRTASLLTKAGSGLMLGGGLSNLYERLRHGKVFDYLRFPRLPGALGRTIFNLADFAIFLGGIFLLLGQRRR